jgi:hypothetical protein
METTPPLESRDRDARAVVADARALVAGLRSRVAHASDADLVALAREAEDLGRVVDALRVRVAGEVDARSDRSGDDRLSARFGCRSAVELLERATGASPGAVNQRIRLDSHTRPRVSLLGEVLPAAFPVVAEALRNGVLGVETARVITDTLHRVRRHGAAPAEHVAVAEQQLVAAATGRPTAEDLPEGETPVPVTFAQLRIQADAWAAWLDPDGAEPDAERACRNRSLTLGTPRNGLVPIRGELMPETAAGLQRMFDAYLNPAVHFTPTGSLGDGLGADPESRGSDDPWAGDEIVHDPRTAAQKRHDVLTAVIHTAAKHPDAPKLGGAAPTLLVTVTDEALTHGGTARLEGADVPVPVSVAHRIACTGAIQKVFLNPKGRIIRLGTPERVFNAHQRRAITARDGGCIIPGCSIPAGWCEIHHVTEHSHGGPTHTDNGVLLCWWHHHNLDRSGWRIRMRNGVPEVSAPAWIDRHRTYRATRPPHRTTRTPARARTRQRGPTRRPEPG